MGDSPDPYGAAERDGREETNSEDREPPRIADTPSEPPRRGADGKDMSEMSTVPTEDRDVVRMEVTVDVSDMPAPDQAAINELADLYEGAFQEVVNKNRDYSWSFLRTGQKLADTPATPFDDPARAQAFGLLTRMGDKHERLVENVYGNGDASVSDTPDVTAQEMANYSMFLAFVLANPDLAAEL